MNQAGYVTLVGFVAREPAIRQTKDGTLVADMRVGTASRIYDKQADCWRDGDTSYFSVICWRRLATAAKASLRKGDPVIVRGRFRTRSYTGRDGVARTEVEITAEVFGHDLTRGIATLVSYGRPREMTPGEMTPGENVAGDQPQAADGQAGGPDGLERSRDEELRGAQSEAQDDPARDDDDPGDDEAPGTASGLPGDPPMTGAPAGFAADDALAQAEVVASELLNADLTGEEVLARTS